MEFGVVNILLLTAAAVAIIGSLKLLLAKDYILQFLRGFAGFSLLVFAILVILFSVNLSSYSQMLEGQVIANVSFTKDKEQQFKANVVNVRNGEEREFILDGDMWQMDARIIRVIAVSKAFYQLERISGRYYSLQQERNNPRSVYGLSSKSIGFDIFKMFNNAGIKLIDAEYGSATYVPMADGASFSVAVTATGLRANPINSAAKNIVSEWQ